MAVPQIAVAIMLLTWAQPLHALAIAALVAAQLWLMTRLLADPAARAPWYNATGVSLFVAGMLISAFAVRAS